MRTARSFAAAEAAARAVPDQREAGPLFGGPPEQAHSPTSRAAARAVAPAAGTLRARVLAHVRACGGAGATDEEIQQATGMPANTERPRRIELVRAGLLVDSGTTARGRSGRAAARWVAVPQ